MKDKFWGLKKDEVNRYMKKLEREFLFDLQKLEFELATIKKENERLHDLIQEREDNQLSGKMNELKELAFARVDRMFDLFRSQSEGEISTLRQSSSEKIDLYQKEIYKIEGEIKSINQIIGRFLTQLEINPIKEEQHTFIEEKHEISVDSLHLNNIQPDSPLEIKFDNEIRDELEELGEETLHEETKGSIHEETLKDRIISYQKENSLSIQNQDDKSEMKLAGANAVKEDDVLNQILTFKEQYINGKKTGSDLFNHSGKLIIPVNTKITKEIIDLAASENKLAELIINMKV
jgi:hypothetical protein